MAMNCQITELGWGNTECLLDLDLFLIQAMYMSAMTKAILFVYMNREVLLDHFWNKIERQLDYERS